jgi:hypothetical protein
MLVHRILDWLEHLPLSSVADHIVAGLAVNRLQAEDGVRVPLVNIRHVQDGFLPPPEQLDERMVSAQADVSRYVLRERDVLLTCRGTQLRTGIATVASAGALISSNLIAIRTTERLLPEILLAFLRSGEGQRALLSVGQGTTGLFLKPGDIGRIEVPVPPLEIQRRLAELIDVSERHHRAAVAAAERRRALAQSVVERVFRRPSSGA